MPPRRPGFAFGSLIQLRRTLLGLALLLSAGWSGAVVPPGTSSPEPDAGTMTPWWYYQSVGSVAFFGAAPGKYVAVLLLNDTTYVYTVQDASPDANGIEHSYNRTYHFAPDGRLEIQRVEKVSLRDGIVLRTAVAETGYEPPIPLRPGLSWNTSVRESIARSDQLAGEPAHWDNLTLWVAHSVAVDGDRVSWTRDDSVHEFLWGHGWVLSESENGGTIRLQESNFVAGDFDADGVPDTEDDDRDGDGIPDSVDDDSDNDGVPDAAETSAGTDSLDPNSRPEKPLSTGIGEALESPGAVDPGSLRSPSWLIWMGALGAASATVVTATMIRRRRS